MISVAEAKRLIAETIRSLSPEMVDLTLAHGMVLAADVRAAVDVPSFDQSSMDGYALNFKDFLDGQRLAAAGSDGALVGLDAAGGLVIQGVIPAGKPSGVALQRGQAARIFTGGALPEGADTVVMQEKVRVENGKLFINDEQLAKGINVRPRGAEIKTGDLGLTKGTLLSPGAVGFLATIGIGAANVYPKARIGILVTGDELKTPGMPLEPGEVYEANSYTLGAAVKQFGCNKLSIGYLKDIPHIIEENLSHALRENDMVLLTGGVSVGDFDYVAKAASNLGVETVFHRVAQKPGKPLYFGRLGNKYIFGLPGNPASSLVAFYEYVLPALCTLTGRQPGLQVFKAPLKEPFSKPPGLTQFLKAFYHYHTHTVRILSAQESYRLSSFAQANCLVQVDAAITHLQQEDIVEVHLLPQG